MNKGLPDNVSRMNMVHKSSEVSIDAHPYKDNPCIKTGAWLWLKQYNHGLYCDLYRVGTALIARVISGQTPVSIDDHDQHEWWATMYDIRLTYADTNINHTMVTHISDNYVIHRQYDFDPTKGEYVKNKVTIRVG